MKGGPGFDLAEKAAHTVARHSLLSGGETVVVGLSGGPDSTCLLHVLARLDADLTLIVAHVDHGLSPESEDVAARVTTRAADAGYDVHLARARDLEGPNVHARARDFRYSFFSALADKEDAGKIATGHTLDDRVETTVARLIHGAGTDVLAGIPIEDGPRIRPLLELRRAETRRYCTEVGLDFVDDPANEDPRFERPAVRAEVIAPIERLWGDGAVRAMATSAQRLREDSVALRGLGERLFAEISETGEGVVTLDLATLVGLPRALRRRILESAVGRVRDRSGGIDAALDALDDPDRGADARFAVAEGTEIVIGREKVRVSTG